MPRRRRRAKPGAQAGKEEPECRCGKAIYRTQAAAIGVALRASKRSGQALRIYRCPERPGWHLTKKRRWHDGPGPRPDEPP